jgi:hypothetical protein
MRFDGTGMGFAKMTVLTIRAHKRYATRQPVRMRAGRAKAVAGLLIELSAEGIRISNLGSAKFEVGQDVTVAIGEREYQGRVRWSHDGIAGVRLDRALHSPEIAYLLEFGRAAPEPIRQVA